MKKPSNKTTGAPVAVLECLKVLHTERAIVSSRLDALDRAIVNVSRVWGLDGQPQPEPVQARRQKPQRQQKTRARVDDSNSATERRELILKAISRSEVGLTLAELRKAVPSLDGKTRSNALQQLKALNAIRRVKNTWVQAA